MRLKVLSADVESEFHVWFQFQTGAIKSVRFGTVASHVPLCFNSKLVRLKGCRVKSWTSLCARFNSKLVRLKVAACDEFGVGKDFMFQFQTGAIKSDRLQARLDDFGTFQFQTGAIKRRPQNRATHPPEPTFQFQTGAIKSACEKDIPTESTSFNSKLVRLKAATLLRVSSERVNVSIPNWCD